MCPAKGESSAADVRFCELVTHQSVQRLVSSLARLEAIVNLVRPRTHLHGPDEVGVDIGLLVEVRQKTLQVVPHEVWLGACSRVQRRDREATDSLHHAESGILYQN